MGRINIIADTHNVPALEKILQKLENVISLGDIAAVDTKEYLSNMKRYSSSWKGYKKNLPKLSLEDRKWFEDLNRSGWRLQMENIKKNAKAFKVTMGNSDEYMIKHIPDVREFLMTTQEENSTFSFKERVELETVDNIQLLFLPFRKVSFIPDIQRIEEEFDINKTLFIFGHCPPYENHKKKYYIMHNEVLEFISNLVKKQFYYFHGHIHSDKTYKYRIPNIPNLTIVTPKAPDTNHGINWNHDYIEIDTNTAKMHVHAIDSGDEVEFSDLPIGYREKEDHWNDFVKPS